VPSQTEVLPADSADDDALRERLAAMVDAAYAIAEAGMWVSGTSRVTPAEIGELIRAGRLIALRDGDQVAGCVSTRDLGDGVWGFGMLAVDPGRQGGGGGRALLAAAEQRARAAGARTMQLELLVPLHGGQRSKVRLKAWYSAHGYAQIGRGALEHDHPDLLPLLAVPCDYEIWHKPLAA
jgi:GNAT superfamily N-acetyltransferase